MKFNKEDKVIYIPIKGKSQIAIIKERRCDYTEGFINNWNEKGPFDYIIEIVATKERKFAQES